MLERRTSFFGILILALLVIGGFVSAYASGNRYASIVAYNRALTATDLSTGIGRLDRSIALAPNDLYWRTRSAVFAQQFTTMAQNESPDKSSLQAAFAQAEASARAAVAWDKTDANNWLALSQVYQLLVGAGNTDAATAAKDAGDEARVRNPNNPLFLQNLAQLAAVQKDTATATDYIAQALTLKPDYLDGYVLRAQLRAAAGEGNAPVDELQQYIAHAPYDEQGYLLLAQAYIAVKDYTHTLDAYGRARQVAPGDPNALLGIINTLATMGQKEQALAALDAFARQFPAISGVEEKRSQIQSIQPPTPPDEKKKS